MAFGKTLHLLNVLLHFVQNFHDHLFQLKLLLAEAPVRRCVLLRPVTLPRSALFLPRGGFRLDAGLLVVRLNSRVAVRPLADLTASSVNFKCGRLLLRFIGRTLRRVFERVSRVSQGGARNSSSGLALHHSQDFVAEAGDVLLELLSIVKKHKKYLLYLKTRPG